MKVQFFLYFFCDCVIKILQRKTFLYTIVLITVMEEMLTEVCMLGKGINLTKIKSCFRDCVKACDVLSLLGLFSLFLEA